ncbi:MAG: STAS domain-containing protein [Bacteroidetes bacterium]|nr:STAS domain-containing protein [Bacteroidota bacterium]
MEIVRSGSRKSPILRVSGKLDAYWADALSTELESCVHRGALTINLDLSAVSFISSAGLRVLLIYIKQMRTINGALRIQEPSEKVRDIFELSGLTDLLLPEQMTAAADVGEEAMDEAPDKSGLFYRSGIGEPEEASPTLFSPPSMQPPIYPQVRFPAPSVGIGIGAFGDLASGIERQFGEFLAAGGIAVCIPTDGRGHPDYMIEDRVFVPTVSVYSGFSVEAAFSEEIRFEASEQRRGMPMSTLAELALGNHSSAVVLMIAEAAGLIGTTLKRSPASSSLQLGLSDVRDQFSFTTEPAFQKTMTVTVGLLSRRPSHVLRPLVREVGLFGHLHTAVFSYRPIPAGTFDTGDFIRSLFDEEHIHTVLHLMYDDRQTLSSVESEFIRGVVLVQPLSADWDTEEGT